MRNLRSLARRCLAALSLVACSTAFTAAHAATLATYDLNAVAGSSLPTATVAPGFTVSPMTAVGLPGAPFSNHFYYPGWDTTLNPGKYLTLTVNHAGPYRLSNLSFSTESTVNAPSTVIVRSSKDGFSTNIASFTWPNDLVSDGTLNLTPIGLVNGSVELRFYFLTTGPGVAAGFANHEPPGAGAGLPDIGRDITLTGQSGATASVPTLSEWSLILMSSILAMIGIARMRRKR